MDIFEEIKSWVVRTVGDAGPYMEVDQLKHTPDSLGLFPQGVQVLRRWEDVLGNAYRRVRYHFLLRLTLPPGEAAARLLLRIQAEAAGEGYAATDGKKSKAASDGLAIYEIRLSAEREELL